ncbi:MAG TPA: hypothetical protein VMG82_31890 [Candidatus Sulfotelmatobacter sp.]|nr:hypothetical protein [Candidatus Sulfotelmatobacter sp.]
MSRQKALAELYEELRNIQVMDRIHDYATEAGHAHERAYVIRQHRRKQILDEITRLKASRSEPVKPVTVGSALAFVWVLGYAMLIYFLR